VYFFLLVGSGLRFIFPPGFPNFEVFGFGAFILFLNALLSYFLIHLSSPFGNFFGDCDFELVFFVVFLLCRFSLDSGPSCQASASLRTFLVFSDFLFLGRSPLA